MAPLNSRLLGAGGSSAISRSAAGKAKESSPQLKQKADEITDKILSRLRPHVHEAALFALERQRDESSAKIWLERRVFRPAQQLFEQATRVKKSNVPAPSRRTTKPSEATGTFRRASDTSTTAPPPPSIERDERDDPGRALRRALSRPDRASTPPRGPTSSRRPIPPPPSGSIQGRSLSVQGSPELSATSPEAPTSIPAPSEPPASKERPSSTQSTDVPPSSPSLMGQEDLFAPLASRLKALRYLDTPEEQATLLLDLLREVAPCSCILVHTVNPKTQQSVAVGAHGEHAAALSGWITEAEDPLLTQLRRTRRPVRVTTPAHDDRSRQDRWAVFSPKKYLAALPVVAGHKLLGFFELADPVDANRFSQAQLQAVEELAQAWAEHLSR